MKNRFYVYIVVLMLVMLGVFYFLNKNETQVKIKTVAFISLSDVDNKTFEGFKNKMNSLGWIENINIKYFVQHPAKNVVNLPQLVTNAIQSNPDMILVSSTPATQEVKKQLKNKTVPVVFCPVNDPVSSDIILYPNAPEGSITGVRLPFGDEKRFEWLYVIAPNTKNVLVPYTKDDGGSIVSRTDIREVAKLLNIQLSEIPIDENSKVEAFMKTVNSSFDAIFLPRDSRVEVRIEEFVEYANNHKLPLSAPSYQQVEKGALYTYGFIHDKLGEDAAVMSDRILKGVKPTDIPVKFGNSYLLLNQTTASIIGINIPKDVINNAHQILK